MEWPASISQGKPERQSFIARLWKLVKKKQSIRLLKDKKKKIGIITTSLIHLYVQKHWITQRGARIVNQSHMISGTKELQEHTLKHVQGKTKRLRKQTKTQSVGTFLYMPHPLNKQRWQTANSR